MSTIIIQQEQYTMVRVSFYFHIKKMDPIQNITVVLYFDLFEVDIIDARSVPTEF
jgi:hypothetical protein